MGGGRPGAACNHAALLFFGGPCARRADGRAVWWEADRERHEVRLGSVDTACAECAASVEITCPMYERSCVCEHITGPACVMSLNDAGIMDLDHGSMKIIRRV